MFMPKLGTMHLRNSFVFNRVVTGFLFFLLIGSLAAQNSSAPAASPNNQPAAPTQQPPSVTPQTQAPPSTQGSTNPAPQNPAAGTQQSPQGQAPPDQSQAPANDNGVFVFRAEAREVTLHATVVDERNRLVTNLNKTDFAVFENNQPQQIKTFRQEDIPVAIGILIDNSGSMREKRAEVNKAALNLVKASNPDDQVFVVNFSDEPILDQDFTSDVKKLQNALEHVESRGGTALYDALVASWNDQLKSTKLQRKVLFLVTDGEDDASQ